MSEKKRDEVRVRLYLSGRVLVTNSETGEVLEDFMVDDPKAAYEILSKTYFGLKEERPT